MADCDGVQKGGDMTPFLGLPWKNWQPDWSQDSQTAIGFNIFFKAELQIGEVIPKNPSTRVEDAMVMITWCMFYSDRPNQLFLYYEMNFPFKS
jgi:hypothetical protein